MPQSNYTLNCIERAVSFMSDEIRNDRMPLLDDIASAAGLSKFHFNRLYKLATGETTQETLTRFKLARAAERLRDENISVTEAAFSAGYGSSQSFAKALKRVLSVSASSIRGDTDRLGVAIEMLVVRQTDDGVKKPDLSVEIAQIEPFKAITLRTDGAYPALNTSYWALFEAVQDPESVQAIIGRPFDEIHSGDMQDLRFDCGLKLTRSPHELPSHIFETDIHGGVYLLTRHVGAYDGLPDAIDRLYFAALSQADIKVSDEPLLFHYLDDPETTSEADLRTDLYLALDI